MRGAALQPPPYLAMGPKQSTRGRYTVGEKTPACSRYNGTGGKGLAFLNNVHYNNCERCSERGDGGGAGRN
jgi:hypothetical protein